jgi:hypothetical protein
MNSLSFLYPLYFPMFIFFMPACFLMSSLAVCALSCHFVGEVYPMASYAC